MNIWTKKSIELANQRNYLDLLFNIYPMPINLRRKLKEKDIEDIKKYFETRDSEKLLEVLLSQEIFPIKDSYVAYLKRDKRSINRNPHTVNRIMEMIYELGIDDLLDRITLPKETNRQIGPMFKNWINSGVLGCAITTSTIEFMESKENIVYNGSDADMKTFANKFLGYDKNKGIDFMAKFNGVYILAEAKFLTDFGGHQNAQFADAVTTMQAPLRKTDYNVKVISILDGVLYIPTKNKMYNSICNDFKNNEVIISAILLKDFLQTIR